MPVSIQLVRLAEASRCVGYALPASSPLRRLLVHKAECNGRASAGGAHTVEGVAVQSHELLHGHWPLAGDFGDDLVFAREDAVLIIQGDGAEMLDQNLR